jgi:polyhydroxyalkanoate synthesis regulator protein
MEAFRRNQAQFRTAMEGAFAGGPFAALAKRNMEMFEAAANAFKSGTTEQAAGGAAPAAEGDELSTLKSQLADLQSKIEKLGK